MDGLSVVSRASDNILRRDTAKESMYISLSQTAVMKGVSAKVKTMAETKNGETTSETEISEINVEANEETGIQAESFKSAVEMESNETVEVKNDKNVVETRNGKDSSKVKCEFPQVTSTISFSSLSEQLTTFLKANPATTSLSENATVNNAEGCATVSEHSITSECQAVYADSDISVSAEQEEPRHKQTDTMQGPSLCDATSSDKLPAVCDFGASTSQDVCMSSVVVKTVMKDLEVGLSSVKVKQEKPLGYDDTDLSAFSISVEDRLQKPEEVKMEPEVMP